ncbi:dTMP kinase [Abyssisolibacter fermentans]|uniref:dTMP kinase n=1 Tax=Abyssisolibacter fermentans TaxID=1766203 RepID=UPI00082B46E0|nr:thymidylate kinase [Abyssisolibacter fermentans]
MRGLLIAIDAVDGSGKETQTRKLYDRLCEDGYNIKKIQFPNYDSPSSSLIKMYLNGDFGKNANEISPYVASTFYAADRYASFKTLWGDFYNEGGIILTDRYTTGNMVHQASKIINKAEKKVFLNWLYDLEFNIYGIPKPDCVIFLDMPINYTKELIKNRANKINGLDNKDIHERDTSYLEASYNNAVEIAQEYNWKRIECVKDEKIRSIEDLHEEIYAYVVQMIKSSIKK